MNNGQTRWSYTDPQPDWPYSTFPVLSAQGIVVFSLTPIDLKSGNAHGGLVGLDERTGRLLWRSQLPGLLVQKPSHLQFPTAEAPGVEAVDGKLYAVSLAGTFNAIVGTALSVTALSITDGRQLWSSAVTQGGATQLDSMLADGLFYEAYDAGRDATAIAALQTSNGVLRWQEQFNQDNYTHLAATPDGIALTHCATITLWDAQSGSLRWQQRVSDQEYMDTFLMGAQGKLVAAYQATYPQSSAGSGSAHLCALEPTNGQTRWCHAFTTQFWVVELGP
jgi:outer membrane protein assembly factor BamB